VSLLRQWTPLPLRTAPIEDGPDRERPEKKIAPKKKNPGDGGIGEGGGVAGAFNRYVGIMTGRFKASEARSLIRS
tara:strand:- start:4657 stop:4881 length:225 start_codon:yes stop_codon:yes gene_type:complete